MNTKSKESMVVEVAAFNWSGLDASQVERLKKLSKSFEFYRSGALQASLQMGSVLCSIRAELPDTWAGFVQLEFGMAARTARRYMGMSDYVQANFGGIESHVLQNLSGHAVELLRKLNDPEILMAVQEKISSGHSINATDVENLADVDNENALKEVISDANKKLADQNLAIEKLEATLDSEREQKTSLLAEKRKLQDDISTLNVKLLNEQNEASKRQAPEAETNEREAEIARQIAIKQQTLTALQSNISALEAKQKKVIRDSDHLKEQVASLESEKGAATQVQSSLKKLGELLGEAVSTIAGVSVAVSRHPKAGEGSKDALKEIQAQWESLNVSFAAAISKI
jgi:hypothetical protein